MEEPVNLLVAGMLSAGYLLAALFFARFWSETRDRLFILFAVAFTTLAVQRVALALLENDRELAPLLYGLRLAAFLIILGAIVDKNRADAPGHR